MFSMLVVIDSDLKTNLEKYQTSDNCVFILDKSSMYGLFMVKFILHQKGRLYMINRGSEIIQKFQNLFYVHIK